MYLSLDLACLVRIKPKWNVNAKKKTIELCKIGVRIKPKWNVNIRKIKIAAIATSVRIKPKWNVNRTISTSTLANVALE